MIVEYKNYWENDIAEQGHEGVCKNHGGLTHKSLLHGFLFYLKKELLKRLSVILAWVVLILRRMMGGDMCMEKI